MKLSTLILALTTLTLTLGVESTLATTYTSRSEDSNVSVAKRITGSPLAVTDIRFVRGTGTPSDVPHDAPESVRVRQFDHLEVTYLIAGSGCSGTKFEGVRLQDVNPGQRQSPLKLIESWTFAAYPTVCVAMAMGVGEATTLIPLGSPYPSSNQSVRIKYTAAERDGSFSIRLLNEREICIRKFESSTGGTSAEVVTCPR